MNVEVVNCPSQYEPLLAFLYPTYSILEKGFGSSKFITHYDVKSLVERDKLNFLYQDAVIISNQIFDVILSEDEIIKRSVEFSRKTLHNRKSKLVLSKDAPVDDCVSFIFQTKSEEQENSILELFDLYGSKQFNTKFLELTNTIPLQVIIAAITTFICKILTADSVYYKRKNITLGQKIRDNFQKALDEYNLRTFLQKSDDYGLSILKFWNDLVQ